MTRTLLAGLLCALALTACGRVGHPLRSPPAPVAPSAAEAAEQEEEEQP